MKDTWVISYTSNFDNVVNMKQVEVDSYEEALLAAIIAAGYDTGMLDDEVLDEDLINFAFDHDLNIGAIKVSI